MRDDPLVRALGFLGLRGRPVAKALMLGVGGALSALGLAALSAWLITRAWQMPPVLYLSVAITAVRALGISRGVFRYLERLATHDLALHAMATCRERLYTALATGSPAYSVTLRRGDLLTRTGDDIDEIGNALIRGLIPIGVGVTTAVAAVVVMALVSVPAALVLAVALIVSGCLAPWLAARGGAQTVRDGARAATDSAEASTAALWHASELVVARRRSAVLAAAAEADRRHLDATDRGIRWQASAAAATPIAMGVSLLAACVIAIQLASENAGSLAGVASGEGLTPMILGVLVLLPLSAFESTAPLTEAGLQIERSRQSAARVMALVDGARADGVAVPDVEVHDSPVRLSTAGLRWGREDRGILGPQTGVDLDLRPGSRLAVVGPSGVGKSTLLLTLAGLLPPMAGGIVCVDDADDSDVELRSAGCYFAEEAHIFSTSVRENLRVARGNASDEQITDALAAVGLGPWAATLPDGLDTTIAGGADAVSGGQRRRLLLARALLHPAPVVLLDEPTEHLDADDAELLLRRLLGIDDDLFGPDRIVVVVTHQPPAELDPANVLDLTGAETRSV
ncbi:thiol reductant ABC exporter subunit CydC [Gordonia jinghuaiqii]|uniref:Thiol reductant ABC exporter subunit CydC n=1 Tax=Gordonia jinghuaiqii TaxID=2758710 RepID=A0A7D7RRG7_9ACTN|nr:thiol reductant ABC exporter subunit CydC [Gordonia jinghuaiqii]MCR5977709.1 thiol reductant ABC exporter subunit CydC [Gordonia jinghuaiqii]QMT02373.1 thiol reductant ABC exporter subunit CydC [Gordonia jinghuaiqii]